MDANKGRTAIWLADTAKHGAAAQRLTDLSANSNSAEWSADGRSVYFLSNRSGSTQVWRVSAGGTAPNGCAGRRRGAGHQPAARRRQLSRLTQGRPDRGERRGLLGLRGSRLHPAAPGRGRPLQGRRRSLRCSCSCGIGTPGATAGARSCLRWISTDVARGTPVNLTGGIGDVPGKPFGGREDYAFSPDGTPRGLFRARHGRRAVVDELRHLRSRRRGRHAAQSDRGQSRLGRAARLLARRHAARLCGDGPAGLRVGSLPPGVARIANPG